MKLEFQMWIGVPETVEVEEPDPQMALDFEQKTTEESEDATHAGGV
jgi:hypothetical protein